MSVYMYTHTQDKDCNTVTVKLFKEY